VRTTQPRRAPARARTSGSLPARALAFVRALPDHPLLDRMIRGRAWIAMLGVMLVGIVAMQVEVLKLGASVGRSLQEGTTLQSRNQLLRASVASLADDQRIERLAAQMGMVMPAPDAVVFLSPHSGADAQRAISNLHAPDPTTFLAALPPTGVAALGATGTAATTQATSTPATTTPATTTPTTTTPSTGATALASTTATGGTTGTSTSPDTTTGGSATGAAGAAGTTVTGSPSTTTTPTTTPTPTSTPPTATGAAAIAPAGTGTTSSGG
jgi:cell division protein FtsL